MATFDEARFFREKALSLSSGLALRLNEFVNEFPAGSPRELIRLTKAFLKKIDAELEASPDPSLRSEYFGLIEVLSNALNWLDNAHTAQTPKALVESLEEISSNLFSNAELLASPSSEYNYSIVDLIPPYKELAKKCLPASSAQDLVASFPKALYLVQFPRIERENGLNLAIFGHEFGHPIADEFISAHEQTAEYAQRLVQAKNLIQSDPELSAAIASISSPIEKNRLLSRFVDTVVVMHRRALQELVSDAVGTQLFGPSLLFASLSIFGQASLDAVASRPSYYPPSRYRLRLISRLLTESDHIKAMKALSLAPSFGELNDSLRAVLEFIESLTTDATDTKATSKNPLARVAYEWLEKTLPDALNHARERTKAIAYLASTAANEVPGLIERLSVDVPPNELGTWPNLTAVDWRSSLLAGWLMALWQLTDSGNGAEKRRQSVAETQKICLKGIEYALLQRQYDARVKVGGGA